MSTWGQNALKKFALLDSQGEDFFLSFFLKKSYS